MTHDFMAMMIAAQRSGVTVTLHFLEGAGMIRSRRGRVIILDREKLEDIAGDAYGRPEAEYRRLHRPDRSDCHHPRSYHSGIGDTGISGCTPVRRKGRYLQHEAHPSQHMTLY